MSLFENPLYVPEGVFEVTDYESGLKFPKFKMADPKWQTNLEVFGFS